MDQVAAVEAEAVKPPAARPATALDVARYLIGGRQATLRLAGCREAIVAAIVFVFSAALAREYDGADLTAKPMELLGPLFASAVLATWFYGVLWAVFLRNAPHPVAAGYYGKLLTLYWMTAPLAWLYAVPYERWMTPYDATVANLVTLGVVSLWRVVLITRAVSVITGAGYLFVLGPVLFFADFVVVPATFMKVFSMVGVMGGIRLTEAQTLVKDVTQVVFLMGLWTFPVWALWTAWSSWRYRKGIVMPSVPSARAHWSLWAAAALSLAVWIPVLPYTQGEQRLETRFDQAARGDQRQYDRAWELLADHELTDFPPHWRITGLQRIVELFEVELRQPTPSRARPFLLQCLEQDIRGHRDDAYYFDPDQVELLAKLLPRLEEGPQLAAEVVANVGDGLETMAKDKQTGQAEKTLRELAERATPK